VTSEAVPTVVEVEVVVVVEVVVMVATVLLSRLSLVAPVVAAVQVVAVVAVVVARKRVGPSVASSARAHSKRLTWGTTTSCSSLIPPSFLPFFLCFLFFLPARFFNCIKFLISLSLNL